MSVVLLGIALTATVIRGPFTIDENNYLVTVLGVRQGRLTVPGTEELPPSRELAYFDPSGYGREVRETPIASTAPPLYAPMAFPFSFFGWRGLVALNTLAFLGTILVVFAFTRRFATTREAPWIAAGAVALGSYSFEYAQGMWPHMLAACLVATGALVCAVALDDARGEWAAIAGLLIALASGVRYQNAFVLGCFGLGLLVLARHRLRASVAFGLGAALPLAASSLMNWMRFGSLNPISKGPGYLMSTAYLAAGEGTFIGKFSTMAWARIVDYSAQPSFAGTRAASFLTPHPESGAYVIVTAVKKAWLQSSPWLIVPLAIMVMVWLPPRQFSRIAGRAPQRALRMISLVVIPTLAMFSASGVTRTDGLCFNQRYFCELVPLMAVAFAWTVEGVGRLRTAILGGALAGSVLALVALSPSHLAPSRHYMVMYLPLALAVLLGVAWALSIARQDASIRPRRQGALAVMIGASMAWALAVHLGDDLQASRMMRRSRHDYLEELRPYISNHSAVFASGAIKDALGPLQLDLDVVIAVPGLDHGATTKALVEAFSAQGRSVYFFLPDVVPSELPAGFLERKELRGLGHLIEVRPLSPSSRTGSG